MKKVKFLRYLNHPKMTKGVQYVPDQVAEFSDRIAKKLVETGHAEYVPEEPRSMDDYELADYDEVVP